MAGERFAVRNSGATAVVEGVGDHGCEYMTRGMVVVLGKTGRNFAAGMTGGVAYVLDQTGEFASESCNRTDVDLEPADRSQGRRVGARPGFAPCGTYRQPAGKWILKHWDAMLPKFVKVFPHEYKRVLGIPRIPASVLAAQAGSHGQGQVIRG